MNLTKQLKDWLIANAGCKADASDSEFQTAAGQALATGKLTAVEFTKLTTTKEDEAVSSIEKSQQETVSLLKELVTTLKGGDGSAADDAAKAAAKAAAQKAADEADAKAKAEADAKVAAEAAKKSQPSKLTKMVASIVGQQVDSEAKDWDVRVKEAADQYSTTKSAALYPDRDQKGRKHSFAGEQLTDNGRSLDSPSDLDKALAGAWGKFQIAAACIKVAGTPLRAFEMLPEHDKELLCYLAEKGEWDDSADNKSRTTKGYRSRESGNVGIKTLIDDATSGGLEAAPIVFDDQIIQAPLLHGELFPLVNTVPLDRGRRVEGVSTSTVTGGWGGVDDSAITLFTTTSYVAAFDTTIFRWEGAIKIGLDFLGDSPIDFGAHITAQYGERLLEDLDDVIANGNGTTQPEGIINKSGITSVAFGGANSISNIESLRYTVTKAEHRANVAATAAFCGTETSYRRWRALPVGASDNRRLFGNDHLAPQGGGYMISGASFRINETLTNAQIFYAVLARYRMYRRRGLVVRQSTEGDTLIRDNSLLISVMARYGGQLERAAAGAITTTAPA